MPAQSKRYLLLLLTIASAIGTLISGFFVFAQQNERFLTLQEAINSGQVSVHGIAEDSSLLQPMLKINWNQPSSSELRIFIESGLILQSTSKAENVVTLPQQKITLVQSEPSSEVFAYTLDYTKGFPNNESKYEVIGTPNELLKPVLNNIIGLKAEYERASQFAVWESYHNVTLIEIQDAIGQDFSQYADRVDQILEENYGPPTDSWLWLVAQILCAGASLLFGTLYWKSAPPKRMIDQLTDWRWFAKGGMAEIWSAEYKPTRQKVIVKLPREASKEVHAKTITYRFNIEIKQHKKLSHPNIVPILEDGISIHPESKKESRYLIQQFVNGCTLDKLLHQQAEQRLPESIIFDIIDKILAALAYIHAKRIVHRDVTFKNIMIAKTGQVYLIDFGNSTSIDSKETKIKNIPSVGTVPFYAPAHIGNVPQRDFYALAIVIYAMYGGELPKGEIQETSAIKETIEQQLDDLGNIPLWLRLVLQQTLNGRYKDSSALRKALRLPELSQMVIGAEAASTNLGHLSSQVATEYRKKIKE